MISAKQVIYAAVAFFSSLNFYNSFYYARAAEAELYAGMASVDVTPVVGVPLAGYGGGERRFFDVFNWYPYATVLSPSVGKRDPIRAKVLVLKKNNGQRLLFIGIDTVGVTKKFRDDFMSRISDFGFANENVFISATHTHSGPGTMGHNAFWALIAVDFYQEEIYQTFLQDMRIAVRRALASMEPAELYATSFEARGLQKNRRDKPGHFDAQANILLVRSKRHRWQGALVNLAMHGTSMSRHNLKYSADVLGEIERRFEKKLKQKNGDDSDVTVIFINGAEGDVAPIHSGEKAMEAIGEAFAKQAIKAVPAAYRVESDWSVRVSEIELGQPGLNIRGCVSVNILRPLIYRKLRLRLSSFLPQKTSLWFLKLGNQYMMSWPGEPTASLGLAVKNIALAHGASQAWLMGLTNDYLSYFTTREEFGAGTYESCASFYGEEGGQLIVDRYRELTSTRPSEVP